MLKNLLLTLILCSTPMLAMDFLQNVEIGLQVFSVVELARTTEEKTMGLQNRKFLPDSNAMAFIFNPPRPQVFWMKGTLVPLDVLFLDVDGRILDIQTMAVEPPQKPGESMERYENRLKRYSCDRPVFCVLEIRAGLAKELDLRIGDVIPALSAMELI